MKQIKYFLGYLHTKRVHFLFSAGMQICQHTTTRRGTWGRWAVSTRQIKHTQVNCWAVEDTIQARDEPARGRALMLTRDLSQVRFFHMVRVQKGSQYIYQASLIGLGQIYGPYGLKYVRDLGQFSFFLRVFFTRGQAGMGSMHPYPYPRTRWVRNFAQ